MTRPSVNSSVRRKVLERDDHTCQKCGHHRYLEIHHIVPVYQGGEDLVGNLITMCKSCHRSAPDDPIDFFKYCSRKGLPPDMERERKMVTTLVTLIRLKPEWKALLSGGEEDFLKLMAIIDGFYADMWKVRVTNSVEELSKLAEKYLVLEQADIESLNKEAGDRDEGF